MRIRLFRNNSCHAWVEAEKVLKKSLKEAGISDSYDVVEVKSNKDAMKYKFFGSPQITINGKDIDPQAKDASQFNVRGCRFYLWKGNMSEYPPKEMLLEALSKN